MIEAQPRILARSHCELLSDFFTAYHRARGVTFELGAVIEGFVGAVSYTHLTAGGRVACNCTRVSTAASYSGASSSPAAIRLA